MIQVADRHHHLSYLPRHGSTEYHILFWACLSYVEKLTRELTIQGGHRVSNKMARPLRCSTYATDLVQLFVHHSEKLFRGFSPRLGAFLSPYPDVLGPEPKSNFTEEERGLGVRERERES